VVDGRAARERAQDLQALVQPPAAGCRIDAAVADLGPVIAARAPPRMSLPGASWLIEASWRAVSSGLRSASR